MKPLLALAFCVPLWCQTSAKPEVDWSAINQQIDALRAAADAHDIAKLHNLSQQFWIFAGDQWVKQSPTAAERLAKAEAQRPLGKFGDLSLPYLAMQAIQAGEFDKAQDYASQTLRSPSPAYDSVHPGNIVLGLVALNRDQDVASAKMYLVSAGKTKGSPILDRWGPNLALAKALLDKGENEAVLEYFQSCKSFVTKNPKLDDWIALLKGGRTPDLSHEYLWFQ
jgi:hypothetical protein